MIPNRITGATRRLGKPGGWDDDAATCAHLPIRDEEHFGVPVMVSSWQPTPAEIEAIVAGAPVILSVAGVGHPPVMLSVGDEPPASGIEAAKPARPEGA